MMNLVTGHRAEAHITAEDIGAYNAAINGSGTYILQEADNLAAEIVTANIIRVHKGGILMQGRYAHLLNAEDVVIYNGTVGQPRCDLIVAHYEKDADTGIESIALAAIQGTAGTTDDPSYIHGSILDNDDVVEVPIYRVVLDGLTITAVVSLAPLLVQLQSHANRTDNPHNVTKAKIGLENVNNTSDEEKPISRATQTALNQKANMEHNHDTVYLRLNGGTITGTTTFNGQIKVGSENVGTTLPAAGSAGRIFLKRV